MAKEIDQSLGVEKTHAGKQRAEDGEDTVKSLGDSRTQLGGLGDELAGLEEELELVDLAARYEIDGLIGQGGMGEVLLATDRRLKRKVAIKRVRGELARNKAALGRFLTEARAVAALAHNNIVQLYDYGRDSHGPFMVMEYVDGGSLLERCRSGPLPLAEAVELTCQLCDGLAVAHEAGIVHRDIKPANILLTQSGTPKLTDFGLAKAELGDASLTITGAVLGTLDFMPPEQRRDAALTDARSDLWSLAATLYQMVTGESPKVIRINRVPSELREFLDKALEEAKDARFQSARDFKQALKQPLVVEAAVELELGECPQCKTKNETSRKFCKKCALPLEVACLGCQSKIPMWDEVCDHCGQKQSVLLKQRKEVMATERRHAEQLLAECVFEEATALAQKLGAEPDPRLRQQQSWSEEFLKAIEVARQQELARTAALFNEALKHEWANDYPSAIHALDQIPARLLNALPHGQKETPAGTLKRVREKVLESKRLEKLVRQRMESRELNGLLPEVEKLLSLCPGKTEIVELKRQLTEREAELRKLRVEVYSRALVFMEAKDYEEVIRGIAKIDVSSLGEELASLRDLALKRRDRLQHLRKEIESKTSSKRFQEALPLVKEALELSPRAEDLQQLQSHLQAWMKKRLSAKAELLDRVRNLQRSGQVKAAIAELMRLPEELSDRQTAAILRECEEQIGKANRNRKLIIAATAFFILVFLAGFGHVLRNSMRAADLRAALAAGNYAEILRLEPDNSDGLALKQKAETISRALAAGNYEEVLRLDASQLPAGAISKLPAAEIFKLSAEAISKLPSKTISKLPPLQNSIGLELKLLPAGTFTMGDSNVEDARPHQVTLTRPFYLGAYEVTQEQYERVMGSNPSSFKGAKNPVDGVSWEDAMEFCRKLSELPEERTAGRVYRLPLEAEWEYACRAGSQTNYSFGENESQLGEYAWYGSSSGRETHPVGERKPNAWGLYDLHGNVWEWCADRYGGYPKGAVIDPVGTGLSPLRVCRGGSWNDGAALCQSAVRDYRDPLFSINLIGFRVALSSPEIPK